MENDLVCQLNFWPQNIRNGVIVSSNIYYFIQLTFSSLSMNISMSLYRKGGDSHEHGFEAGQLSNP